MPSVSTESKSQALGMENTEAKVDIKIAAESKTYTEEEAKQQMQDAIDKVNKRVGQESYTINGIQGNSDAYGIKTIKFNVNYLGKHLTTIETCVEANANGLRRGVDLDSENIAILLAAATIQLKGGVSKDGYLLKNEL